MSPDLLQNSWQTLWRSLRARGDGTAVYEQLLSAYEKPDRHYHSRQHLGECLEHFSIVRAQAQHPGEVEAGLWFHDAVYELQIRREYAFVPEALFHTKRRAVLQSFLDRPAIYSTAHFRALLEARARVNLDRAVNASASPERG